MYYWWRLFTIFLFVKILPNASTEQQQDVSIRAPAQEFTKYATVSLSRVVKDKRHTSADNTGLSLTVPLSGLDVILDLKLNTDIIPDNVSEEEESLCEYIGKVRGVATSRAAVSVCGEPAVVQGTVFDGNNTFYIEPATALQADGHSQIYYIYDRRDLIKQKQKCGTRAFARPRRTVRSIRGWRVRKDIIVRLLLVTGHSVLKKNGRSRGHLEKYCRGLMNDVHSYYSDLGITVKYAGRRHILTQTERRIVDKYNEDEDAPILNFKAYLTRHKNIPIQYDMAVFLSNHVFSRSKTVGAAFTGSACTGPRESTVAVVSTANSWFMTATTMAHEIGHILGLNHEEDESEEFPSCPKDDGLTYIMTGRDEPDKAKWSSCSKEAWKDIKHGGYVDCLESSWLQTNLESDEENYD